MNRLCVFGFASRLALNLPEGFLKLPAQRVSLCQTQCEAPPHVLDHLTSELRLY